MANVQDFLDHREQRCRKVDLSELAESFQAVIDAVKEVAALAAPEDYRGEEVKIYARRKGGLSSSECEPETIVKQGRETRAHRRGDDLRTGAWDREDQVWR
ncbi:MAG: hypothetical protein OEM63_03035 [Gammaproteobacteria bacterium]|nr:hypothetical protein [Gammaproteobacteria bacterium]